MIRTLFHRDRRVPLYFVLFFTVIAAVNTVMVTLAVRTHTGLVTEHPYEKGLDYNKVVDADAAQKTLGWKGKTTLRYEGLNAHIHFTLRDKNGAALSLDKAYVKASRPTQAGMDFDTPLKDGRATLSFPVRGLWELRVFATHNGASFQHAERIEVP